MIFRPELAKLVQNQVKTETRRPVKPGEPCRYEEGKDYAVQPGRGKAQICRIEVETVSRETLGEITHQAALAEGFRNLGHFLDYWEQLYCCAWKMRDGERAWTVVRDLDLDQPVWVIRFALWKSPPPKPGKDTVRLLTTRGHSTTMLPSRLKDGSVLWEPRAMPEPEKVDPAIIDALPATMEARQRWARVHLDQQAARAHLPIGFRVQHAIEQARAAGVDTSRYEAAILRRIEALESRQRKSAA